MGVQHRSKKYTIIIWPVQAVLVTWMLSRLYIPCRTNHSAGAKHPTLCAAIILSRTG